MKTKDSKKKEDTNKIDPKNKSCNMSETTDESFRIDDNSDYSTTSMEENKCFDDPMVPGVGITETETDNSKPEKTKKHNR